MVLPWMARAAANGRVAPFLNVTEVRANGTPVIHDRCHRHFGAAHRLGRNVAGMVVRREYVVWPNLAGLALGEYLFFLEVLAQRAQASVDHRAHVEVAILGSGGELELRHGAFEV